MINRELAVLKLIDAHRTAVQNTAALLTTDNPLAWSCLHIAHQLEKAAEALGDSASSQQMHATRLVWVPDKSDNT